MAESLRPQPADLSRRFLVTREFLQLCVGEEHLSGARHARRRSAANQEITNSYSLTKLVPSLTLTNGGGANTALFINGVGNRTSNSYLDPAIAVSYDGVYMGRASAAFGTAFFDLARVEVLKGPQGILYGKKRHRWRHQHHSQ